MKATMEFQTLFPVVKLVSNVVFRSRIPVLEVGRLENSLVYKIDTSIRCDYSIAFFLMLENYP